MQITVLSATKSQHTSKAGKPYFQLEVAYKGEDGQVKGKKLMPFGSSKPAFDALVTAQSGHIFDVTLVKEGEFWVWTYAKKLEGGTGQSTSDTLQDSPKSTTPTQSGKIIGSNYETAEERKVKQRYIVRQSSVANAIALKGSKASVEEVINVAKQFESYVFDEQVKADTPARLEDMEDDVPL